MCEPESIVDYGPHSVPPTFSKAYESYSMKNNKFYSKKNYIINIISPDIERIIQ